MGYLRGVSCAQRLALPMGLNGPFLSLYTYICIYIYIKRVSRHVCARPSEHSANETKGKENGGLETPVSPPLLRRAKPSRGVSRHPSGFLLSLYVVNQWQTTRLLVPSCL